MDIKTQDCWTIKEGVDLDSPLVIMKPMSFMQKHSDMIILTEAEYLADKKKTDEGWISIDYDNPPKGEVLLLTNSKTILKGDWYENNLVKGIGWRTERSQWAFAPPDGIEYLTLTPKDEIQYYMPLPSTTLNNQADTFLLHLIDTTWNECTESGEVPSTIWAKKIIEKARTTYKK